jgi:hypothetical protein
MIAVKIGFGVLLLIIGGFFFNVTVVSGDYTFVLGVSSICFSLSAAIFIFSTKDAPKKLKIVLYCVSVATTLLAVVSFVGILGTVY